MDDPFRFDECVRGERKGLVVERLDVRHAPDSATHAVRVTVRKRSQFRMRRGLVHEENARRRARDRRRASVGSRPSSRAN